MGGMGGAGGGATVAGHQRGDDAAAGVSEVGANNGRAEEVCPRGPDGHPLSLSSLLLFLSLLLHRPTGMAGQHATLLLTALLALTEESDVMAALTQVTRATCLVCC